jgi:hypothetical protein
MPSPPTAAETQKFGSRKISIMKEKNLNLSNGELFKSISAWNEFSENRRISLILGYMRRIKRYFGKICRKFLAIEKLDISEMGN